MDLYARKCAFVLTGNLVIKLPVSVLKEVVRQDTEGKHATKVFLYTRHPTSGLDCLR